MNRLRVLKLGWEFPPLINGGLGVACLGLSRALAKHVDLTVVVPKSSPDADFKDFELRGLNQLTIEKLKSVEGRYRYDSFAQVRNVPVFLAPYEDGELAESSMAHLKITPGGEAVFSETTIQQLESFQTDDLYGPDLGSKVIEFSKVAAKLALLEPFDVIHAHDWITFLAGVEVKKATGKPLIAHVHALQYDRAWADARGWIYDLEK